MKTEIEAKFYPVVKEDIRSKLKTIGAELVTPELKLRRTIFDNKFNPQIQGDYIRIRDEGNNIIRLSLKIHARQGGDLSDQKEVDVIVSNYEDTSEILEMAGLKISGYQETLRETWKYLDAEIVIDTWPGLETYIEIEAKSEQSVREIAEKLGQNWDSRRVTSVVEIYAEIYKLTYAEVLKKLENITFENNPFS